MTDDTAHVERCVACGEALNRLANDWTPTPGGRAIHDGCQGAWVRQAAQRTESGTQTDRKGGATIGRGTTNGNCVAPQRRNKRGEHGGSGEAEAEQGAA